MRFTRKYQRRTWKGRYHGYDIPVYNKLSLPDSEPRNTRATTLAAWMQRGEEP